MEMSERYTMYCDSVKEMGECLELIESDSTIGDEDSIRFLGTRQAETRKLWEWRVIYRSLKNNKGNLCGLWSRKKK